MSVTKISFRAVTNIVKAGCKSNKLISVILEDFYNHFISKQF